MILAAAGAVDHEAIVRQCEQIFGDLVPRDQKQLLAGSFTGGEVRHIKDLEQAHFAFAFEGPNYTNSDIYTAQVFATAFGGGMSSRLFQEVREKRGLCYSIFASAGAYSDTGTLTLYAGTSGDKVSELANITMDEIKRAADNMNENEVTRACIQMKAGLLMGLESPSSRAERLARMLAIWDRVPALDEVVEKIDGVTVNAVRSFAASMIGGSPAALALYGPVKDAPNVEELQARLVA
jgi:predicted Zn-dependent peptidase